MSRAFPVPSALRHGAFTLAEAVAAGVTRRTLQGPSYASIHRGVYVWTELEPSPRVLVGADLLLLPRDASISHVSAMHWYGVQIGPTVERHYSTNTGRRRV